MPGEGSGSGDIEPAGMTDTRGLTSSTDMASGSSAITGSYPGSTLAGPGHSSDSSNQVVTCFCG
ncbi:unnamed protein product [Echinostoma caproni]|uniref:Uncharacterized protein n=1 Tax=Echinostoma caproni TaxID=27848 RepID=A0A3P8L772_9TREM|nr:unnamed protein product [Echinostoma caproni]